MKCWRMTYYLIDKSLNCPCDSEQVEAMIDGLRQNGWRSIKDIRKAEIILMKFCCITEKEISEDIETLKSTLKKGYVGKIFIGFCMAKSEEMRQAITECLPNKNITFFKSNQELFELLGISAERHEVLTVKRGIPIVNITYGCNRRCAFCKVAYVRNEFRSIPMTEIISKVMLAKKKGHKMVLLSAMNATEYADKGKSLADLLRALLEIPDMLYQLNGLVLAELTQEMISLIQNPRFFYIQLEVQSFIAEVRKNMLIGMMTEDRILEILKSFKGKGISSCIMIGCAGERDSSFRNQLKLIEENNLYFLTVDPLVPTPGTKCATMKNVPSDIVDERVIDLSKILLKLRAKKAKECLKATFSGVVLHKAGSEVTVVIDTGIMVKAKMPGASIGDIVEVTPRYVEKLIAGENQVITLSTQPTDASKVIEYIQKDMLSKPPKTSDPKEIVARARIANAVSPEEFMFEIMPGMGMDSQSSTNKSSTCYSGRTLTEFVKMQLKGFEI